MVAVDEATHALCPLATLEAVRADAVRCELARDIARADARLAQRQRDALAEHVAALVALPAPEGLRWWHVAGAATVAGGVGLLAGLLLAR